MTQEKFLGKDTTVIDEHNTLMEVHKGKDGVIWSEVYILGDRTKDYIGICTITGLPHRREWINYNTQYVAFFSQIVSDEGEYSPEIKRMYDVQSKQFVKGTQEELQTVYNFSFNGEKKSAESTK